MDEVTLSIDGHEVTVPRGTTLLQAARRLGIDTPTLCYHPNLTPPSACRVCVMELEGARTLVPSCSRECQTGMKVRTDSARVRLSRRTVIELLQSANDLAYAPEIARWAPHYGSNPDRFGPGARIAPPPHDDNPFFVRDYAACIVCQRCTEACGVDVQHNFAITIAGRGFHATVATLWDRVLTETSCVFCGNCVGVCPTGALVPRPEWEARQAGVWPASPAAGGEVSR